LDLVGKGLSAKERVWLNEYLKCFNATEAARRAGYKHPPQLGPRLKKKHEDLIGEALAEQVVSPGMLLSRLADQALNLGMDFIDSQGIVDLDALKAAGLMHLVKSVKHDRWGNSVVEFHDAQAALVAIGKHYKLFTEQSAFDGTITITGLDDLLDRIYGNDKRTINLENAPAIPAERSEQS